MTATVNPYQMEVGKGMGIIIKKQACTAEQVELHHVKCLTARSCSMQGFLAYCMEADVFPKRKQFVIQHFMGGFAQI